MPFIEVEELQEGQVEAPVILIEDANKREAELTAQINSLQERIDTAIDELAKWQEQANTYSQKYADIVLSRKAGTGSEPSAKAPTIKTSIKELFAKEN